MTPTQKARKKTALAYLRQALKALRDEPTTYITLAADEAERAGMKSEAKKLWEAYRAIYEMGKGLRAIEEEIRND